MIRNVLIPTAGVLVAGSVIALTEAAGHAVLSGDGRFGAAVAGYGLGTMAGTALATRFAGRRPATAVPVVIAAMAAVNLLGFPHPTWFAPAAVASIALGWFLGSRVTSASAGPPTATP